MPDFTLRMENTSSQEVRVEPATIEELPRLIDLLGDLFREEADFEPNAAAQERGLRLILENPTRGRIFVVRKGQQIVGMVNLLFTVSTAHGGHAILLEDVVIAAEYRDLGYGAKLMEHVIQYARRKDFVRITLLTDRISTDSQRFFQRFGFVRSEMVPMRLVLRGVGA
mgnify:CR=1 FL=1